MRHSAAMQRVFASLVVLALVFKAMIPTGFMLSSVDGQLRLVMCPAGIHAHMNMPMPMSMHHHGSAIDHAAHAAASADQCPFALATGGALQSHTSCVAAPYFSLMRPLAPDAFNSIPVPPPIRHLAPRGPPSLA